MKHQLLASFAVPPLCCNGTAPAPLSTAVQLLAGSRVIAIVSDTALDEARNFMDESKAHSIIAALANGVDPFTGKAFPPESLYQTPDIVRALYIAAQALDTKGRARGRARDELPANAGKPWNDEEDRRLLTQFDSGQNIQVLAQAHARTVAGIQARLERHGRLQPASPSPQRRPQQQAAGRAASAEPSAQSSTQPVQADRGRVRTRAE